MIVSSENWDRHGAGIVIWRQSDVMNTWFYLDLWSFSAMGWPESEIPVSALCNTEFICHIYLNALRQWCIVDHGPCRHGAGVVLRQETYVLDTWFSSGQWAFVTLAWKDPEAPDLAC
jgi:valyl-tRNA synthetase